jgi:hypothetical protein
MHQGKMVFAQAMAHQRRSRFHRCVSRCSGECKVNSFSGFDQLYAMAFALLTSCQSLRDIEPTGKSRRGGNGASAIRATGRATSTACAVNVGTISGPTNGTGRPAPQVRSGGARPEGAGRARS